MSTCCPAQTHPSDRRRSTTHLSSTWPPLSPSARQLPSTVKAKITPQGTCCLKGHRNNPKSQIHKGNILSAYIYFPFRSSGFPTTVDFERALPLFTRQWISPSMLCGTRVFLIHVKEWAVLDPLQKLFQNQELLHGSFLWTANNDSIKALYHVWTLWNVFCKIFSDLGKISSDIPKNMWKGNMDAPSTKPSTTSGCRGN